MKSFDIKLENRAEQKYLIEQLEQIELDNLYISSFRFKVYENVIVHYTGENIVLFMQLLSQAIANTIQKFYEEKLLVRIINKNYFYLSEEEQESIIRISNKILLANREQDDFEKEILKELIYEYIEENKKMILSGFVIFRTKEYKETLDYIAELAVTSYLNLLQY